MALHYILLVHCLYLWYSTIFFWSPAYTYGTLLSTTRNLLIPMVLYYLPLIHCLYLRYSTICYWSPALVLFYIPLDTCLYLWYSSILYWLPDYPYNTLLSSSGSLTIPLVLYYRLLASCLYLWYYIIFYWLSVYTYGTLLPFYWPSANNYGTILYSTGSLLIPMVLYYLLLAHCLYLWYSSIFYLLTARSSTFFYWQ